MSETENVTTPTPTVTPPPPTEAPKEPEKPAEDADPLAIAKRFSALGRKEREIREQREAFEREKTELTQKASLADELTSLQRAAKEGDAQAAQKILDRMELSFDDLARLLLSNAETPKEYQELKGEIKQLRSELEEKEKKAKEERVASEQRYIDEQIDLYRQDVQKHIQQNPDRFELIIANEAQDAVFSYVEQAFEATGEVITPEEAASHIEKILEEEAEKLLKAKKISSRLKMEPQENAQDEREKRRPSPTIGNRASVSPTVSVKTPEARTEEERMERALAALRARKRIED